jgi:hypothetical protein
MNRTTKLSAGLFSVLMGLLCLQHLGYAQQYPPNIPVSQRPHSESETAIAFSPVNPGYVLAGWNAKITGVGDKSGYAFSYDGGQSWADSLLVDPIDPMGIDPSVAFDRHGNAFFCHIGGIDNSENWIRVWRRAVPNGSWTQTPVSRKATAWPTNDKPYIAIDNSGFTSPGKIYVAWTEYDWPVENRIKFNMSIDGQTFDTLAAITLDEGHNTVQATDLSFTSLLGALPVVGPSGELYVFWARGSQASGGTIAFRKSTDGGTSWDPPLDSAAASTVNLRPLFGSLSYGGLQIYTFPSVSIDTNGVVYVAFTSIPPSYTEGVVTVYLTKSTDGGTTWRWGDSDTIKTNQDSPGLRFMPWLTVDKWNALHLVYYHGPGQNLANAYIASLFDNESTFQYPDIRINEVALNATQIGRPMHYIGIAAGGNGDILPCWTDTRNGGTNKGDSYTSRLDLSSPQAPVLTQPLDRAPLTSNNLSFAWTAAFGARQYRFELDDDPSFDDPFVDLISSPEYQYTGDSLTADVTYFWRVRSENALGVGSYTQPRRFVLRDALQVQTTYPVNWNLASVPLYVAYFHRDSVWGNRIGQPFKYDNGYVEVAMLENGPGYWVKFPSTETTVDYVGGWWDTLNVSVGTNWNIIGSTHATVDTEDIQYVGTSRGSNYFKYDNGYQIATTIEPGFGYWVKFNSAGTIRLIASVAMSPSGGGEDELATYDKFTIMDAEGKQQDLYVRNGTLPSSFEDEYWEIPPAPPEEAFDVRLETDMFVKTVEPTPEPVDLTFLMTGVAFPATLNWQINPENGITYTLPDSSGGLGKVSALSNVGIMTLTNRSNRLQLRARIPLSSEPATLPKEFALRQNYPNPFNPTTTIKYDLPLDAKVTLRLYDVLGREVMSLVDGVMPAGFHQVTVDGSALASGVYLYRIDAGSFTQVKKLLLLR